jgi:hypothetical protein
MALFISPSRTMSVSTFCNHVLSVVFHRSKKKMVWTNTFGIITAMKYAQAVRDRTKMHFPGKAMRSCFSVLSTSNAYKAVTLAITTRSPQPTSIVFFNFLPKSFNKRSAFSWVGHSWNIMLSCPLCTVQSSFFRCPKFSSALLGNRLSLFCFGIRRNSSFYTSFAARRQTRFLGFLLKKRGQWLRCAIKRTFWVSTYFSFHAVII